LRTSFGAVQIVILNGRSVMDEKGGGRGRGVFLLYGSIEQWRKRGREVTSQRKYQKKARRKYQDRRV